MDDKDITALFRNFDPELPSDIDFMARLQQRLDVAELVRHEHAVMQKRNRIALIIAACAGFVMGVTLTLLYPLLSDWLTTIELSGLASRAAVTCYSYAAWSLMALLSAATAINSYEFTLARFRRKHTYS